METPCQEFTKQQRYASLYAVCKMNQYSPIHHKLWNITHSFANWIITGRHEPPWEGMWAKRDVEGKKDKENEEERAQKKNPG